MKFSEVARRLTGISCPIFGVSWNPGESKVTYARQTLTYLEDRRVLYAPWNVEVPEHCVRVDPRYSAYPHRTLGSTR